MRFGEHVDDLQGVGHPARVGVTLPLIGGILQDTDDFKQSGCSMLALRANDTDFAVAAGNYFRVKDGKVTHTQNGVKVVEYTLWTPEWDAMVQNSKFKTFPGFTEGIAREGYIGLQDHGYAIWFRNIKIREL